MVLHLKLHYTNIAIEQFKMLSISDPVDTNENPEPDFHDFMSRIGSFPLDTQYIFIEFFGKSKNKHFKNNLIVERYVQHFNTINLKDTDDQLVKQIITSGLKILSDELCKIFIVLKAECDDFDTTQKNRNYETNCYALNAYFELIHILIGTLDIQTIKDILLDVFDLDQYKCSINTVEQVTVSHLKNAVFDDLDNLEMELVEIDCERRLDRFDQCRGTIVMMVKNTCRDTSYYLVFDVLTKKVFMYNRGDLDKNWEIKTPDFKLNIWGWWFRNRYSDEFNKNIDKLSTCTSTNPNVITPSTQSSNNFFIKTFCACILFFIIIPSLITFLILAFWAHNAISDFIEIVNVITDPEKQYFK